MIDSSQDVRAQRVAAIPALLIFAVLMAGCSAAAQANTGESGAAAATLAPAPAPVVVSTPGSDAATPATENRRLAASSRAYDGEILADTILPFVAEVAGQIMDVSVKVGDAVKPGDVLVRVDSSVAEAQRTQALAGLELAQSQLELAQTQPKETDLAAAVAGVKAARAAYDRALQGPTEEDKRMMLAQLRQAEAAVALYQSQYDRIASDPFAGMMPQSLQLQQATLGLEAARAGNDKLLKGATADVIAGAYAQLTAADAQLARLKRGAEPAQVKAAEAGVKQAETAVYLAQLQLDKTTIEAPAGGFVYKLDAIAGGMAGPGTVLGVIFSDSVKILIDVEESRYQDVHAGQPVTIRVDAFPDREFDGEVSAIAPTLDHATRTVEVTVRPTGEGATLLKPGMFANVQFVES